MKTHLSYRIQGYHKIVIKLLFVIRCSLSMTLTSDRLLAIDRTDN